MLDFPLVARVVSGGAKRIARQYGCGLSGTVIISAMTWQYGSL
jgi:hypothetical protein